MGETEGEGGTAATSGLFFFKHIFQPHVLISAVLCCDTFLCPFLLVFSIICSCRFVLKKQEELFSFYCTGFGLDRGSTLVCSSEKDRVMDVFLVEQYAYHGRLSTSSQYVHFFYRTLCPYSSVA